LKARHLLVLFLFCIPFSTGEAQRRLTGRVTGAGAGEPVASANVLVVDTRIGTLTDAEGRFNLSVPEGELALQVRRIGYRPRVVPVAAGQTEVNVVLDRDVLQLTELVVTGQATSVARQNAANDIATVSAAELTRVPTPTMENALQGKVAGALVQQNSGAPGGGMQVQLRGVTTINAASGPLYVVDGVIVSNDAIASGANAVTAAAAGGNASNQDNPVNRIADLNPNDIERIEILKGASASAIYGSKASNGVIIITTKRGTGGAPDFRITQRVGTYQLSNKIGSRQWTLPGVYDYFRPATAADTARYRALFGSGVHTDYEQTLFGETDLSYETSASVTGASGGTRYFLSGLNKRDAGIMQGTGYDKQGLRANLSQSIGSRLNVDVNTSFVHALTRRGLSNNDNSGTSYYMVLPFTPSFVQLAGNGATYPANPFERSNPLQTRDLLENDEEVYRFTGAVQGAYSLLASQSQTLDLRVIGGVDQFSQRNDILSPNELLFEPQDGLPGTVVQGNTGVVNANVSLSAVHAWTPAGGALTATTSAGVQREQRDLNTTSIVTRGLIPGQTAVNQGSNINVAPLRQRVRDFAFYMQEEVLALDERLLLTVGGRADRSTNNGDKDKFYFFPKAAASYRLPAIWRVDELKVRAAVGQSGNPAIYGSRFTSLATGIMDGQTGVQVGQIAGAPDIRPERQTEVEGGVDAQLYDGRASLSVTGYQKDVDDLILLRNLPPSSGFAQEFFNGASLRNRGVEITAQLIPFQRGLSDWVSRITFARNVSEITHLPVPPFATGGFGVGLGAFQIEEGKSATQIIGRKVVKNAAGADTTIITQLGDAAPDFQMAFSNELTIGRWRLSGLLDWKRGGDIINLTEFLYDAAGNSPDYSEDPKSPGQVRFNGWAAGNTGFYVQDGSYVKLRELSVAYNVPTELANRVLGAARSMRVELSGRNLFTATPYRGLDPEVSNFGNQAIVRNIDVAPYPPSRSFFLTIDVGF
jgi:TonB-dependent starch-binding outer membrane protein SusC